MKAYSIIYVQSGMNSYKIGENKKQKKAQIENVTVRSSIHIFLILVPIRSDFGPVNSP